MKTIIAGCRSIPAPISAMCVETAAKQSGFAITQVVCGCADGIDLAGYAYAREVLDVSVEFYPGWQRQHEWAMSVRRPGEGVCRPPDSGRANGPIRNRWMADYADALIAIWDGKSKGTANMIETARKHGLKVFVYQV